MRPSLADVNLLANQQVRIGIRGGELFELFETTRADTLASVGPGVMMVGRSYPGLIGSVALVRGLHRASVREMASIIQPASAPIRCTNFLRVISPRRNHQ